MLPIIGESHETSWKETLQLLFPLSSIFVSHPFNLGYGSITLPNLLSLTSTLPSMLPIQWTFAVLISLHLPVAIGSVELLSSWNSLSSGLLWSSLLDLSLCLFCHFPVWMNLNFYSRNMGISESHHSTSKCFINIPIYPKLMPLTILNFSSTRTTSFFLCCLCQSMAPCCPGQKCWYSFCVLSLSDTRYYFINSKTIYCLSLFWLSG